MQINPVLLANLPDTLAMPVMAGFILALRRRYPRLDTRSWLIALMFIFLSQITWIAHGHPLLQQTLVLNGELLAGIAFCAYRGNALSLRDAELVYLILNGLPFVAVETLYARGVHAIVPYVAALAAGVVTVGVTTWWRRQNWYRAAMVAAGYLLLMWLVAAGAEAFVAYWGLAAVYAYAAWNFRSRLPENGIGKIAILLSTALLAICYALQPWVLHYGIYAGVVTQLWRLQTFFVSGGMLLVMVENQSARHHFLAMHDQLTGLPNRRMLDVRLREEIEYAQKSGSRLTMLMIDLNGFKQINDSHGHLAGDHVLHTTAKRLRDHLRSSELVARLGGDEFVVLSRHATGDDGVQSLTALVQKWMREPIDWDRGRLWVHSSVGAARFPEDVARWSDDVHQDSAERVAGAMLRIADMRMYALKPSSRAAVADLEHRLPTQTLLQ